MNPVKQMVNTFNSSEIIYLSTIFKLGPDCLESLSHVLPTDLLLSSHSFSRRYLAVLLMPFSMDT